MSVGDWPAPRAKLDAQSWRAQVEVVSGDVLDRGSRCVAGRRAFVAWADEPISKHTRVLVIDTTSARSVVVTPFP